MSEQLLETAEHIVLGVFQVIIAYFAYMAGKRRGNGKP